MHKVMMNREEVTRWRRNGRRLPHPQDMERVLVYLRQYRVRDTHIKTILLKLPGLFVAV